MLEHVARVAPLAKPVLVVGERGTGKELIASRLHYLSARWEQPLIKVNCAALTESLLETELFGHEAGAFTGATRTHVGRFEQADGGTLVLDELGTIPLRMQEKILRVIEYGEFQRVGGIETLSTDVRIVGATNENLPRLVSRGRFRSDLLDRMAFDVIHIPPLRARAPDILTLAYRFAVDITSELGRPVFSGFSESARSALVGHRWPGNVRELKNAVERSVFRLEETAIPVNEILFDPFESPFAVPGGADSHGEREPLARSDSRRKLELPLSFKDAVAGLEVDLLSEAMSQAQYNQRIAAELLGLSYHQLRGLLRKRGVGRGSGASTADGS